MNNTISKKTTILFLIIMIALSKIPAKCQFWLGTGFISHSAKLDESEKHNFHTIDTNTQNINEITYIGPSVDFNFIPYQQIPLGINFNSEILFPVGFNKNNYFRSYHFDFKNRNMIGFNYNQMFSDSFGMFFEAGYELDLYNIATTNQPNNKATPDYHRFLNHSLYGELGFLTTINHGYFKFGANYSHSIINNASSIDLVFKGGFIF